MKLKSNHVNSARKSIIVRQYEKVKNTLWLEIRERSLRRRDETTHMNVGVDMVGKKNGS